jgi:TRAP-type C4-dicarboxylate transport system permease large subunit
MLTVAIYVRISPEAAARAPRVPYKQRFKTLLRVWPVVVIFGLVIGGIAADWDWTKKGVQALFTPTEGAAFGVVATAIYGVGTGGLTWRGFLDSILSAASASAMIFLIILGAQLFNSFLPFTQAPQAMDEWVNTRGYAPMTILVLMLVFYLIFGCVMDSLSMILRTIPIFFPIIEALDFGLTGEETAIWFGILALIVVEVGVITPPVGMNLFIINSLDRSIPMSQTYRGVIPFVLSDLVRVAILVLFPGITLWLVGVMF